MTGRPTCTRVRGDGAMMPVLSNAVHSHMQVGSCGFLPIDDVAAAYDAAPSVHAAVHVSNDDVPSTGDHTRSS